MSDTIDRGRLARQRAKGEQLMAYVNEHEAEWMEVSNQLEAALRAWQEFSLEAGATVNGSVNNCLRFVLEYFAPSDVE